MSPLPSASSRRARDAAAREPDQATYRVRTQGGIREQAATGGLQWRGGGRRLLAPGLQVVRRLELEDVRADPLLPVEVLAGQVARALDQTEAALPGAQEGDGAGSAWGVLRAGREQADDGSTDLLLAAALERAVHDKLGRRVEERQDVAGLERPQGDDAPVGRRRGLARRVDLEREVRPARRVCVEQRRVELDVVGRAWADLLARRRQQKGFSREQDGRDGRGETCLDGRVGLWSPAMASERTCQQQPL